MGWVWVVGLIPILQWYRAGLVRRRAQAQSSASSASALDAPAVKAKGWLLGEETVENMQIWSMLAYYPLEHICTSEANGGGSKGKGED